MKPALLPIVVLVCLPASEDVRESAPRQLLLVSEGSPIRMHGELESELADALDLYLESCLPFESVVLGEPPPRDELERAWSQQSSRPHALLDSIGSPDSRHAHLRGKPFTLLVGLESESGPSPVLTRDRDQRLIRYIKCPDLDGLLLSCRLHGLLPGMSPSPECERWTSLGGDP